jgi:cold shock CspA family protein
MSESNRLKGILSNFYETKGFGFIKVTDHRDVFVHISDYPQGQLNYNDLLEFDVIQTSKGDKAINIVKLNSDEDLENTND